MDVENEVVLTISKRLLSKIISACIIWCFASWGVYLNFYSESVVYKILSGLPLFSLNITYTFKKSHLNVIKQLEYTPSISIYEMIAFILSVIFCVCGALILGYIISMFINYTSRKWRDENA